MQMRSAAMLQRKALAPGQENRDLTLLTSQGDAFATSEVLEVLPVPDARCEHPHTDRSCKRDKMQLCIPQACPKGKLVLAAQV